MTKFKSKVETLKFAGGDNMLVSEALLGMEIRNATVAQIKVEREKFLAVCYIMRSDKGHYKKLLDDLMSLANCGRGEYPETLTDAFNLLI